SGCTRLRRPAVICGGVLSRHRRRPRRRQPLAVASGQRHRGVAADAVDRWGAGCEVADPCGGRMRTGRVALTGFVLAATAVLGGPWAAPPPAAALAAGHRHPPGWTAERRGGPGGEREA